MWIAEPRDSASITRTRLGATDVSCAPTWAAGAAGSGLLSLRMLECQPRSVIRSQAGSPAGPRSPASYVSHARIWSGTQTTVLLTNRSRTNTQSSQSCASAGWVDGADCSFQCWSARSTLFMHCLPAGTRVGRQPASAKAPLRCGCGDATSGRTRTVTPCSGGITSLGRHDGSY